METFIDDSILENNIVDEDIMVSRYYQRYNSRIDRWIKIDSYTGLIVAVKKSPGEYKNIPKTPGGKVKRHKAFWDFF